MYTRSTTMHLLHILTTKNHVKATVLQTITVSTNPAPGELSQQEAQALEEKTARDYRNCLRWTTRTTKTGKTQGDFKADPFGEGYTFGLRNTKDGRHRMCLYSTSDKESIMDRADEAYEPESNPLAEYSREELEEMYRDHIQAMDIAATRRLEKIAHLEQQNYELQKQIEELQKQIQTPQQP